MTIDTTGICHAEAIDGTLLPVIDVTHPAFAAECTDAELAAAAARSLKHLNGRRPPAFILRWMARRSVIVRDLSRASGGVLAGMATYRQKLGPENAGPWASALDRRLLREIVPICARIRVRAVAHRLAAEICPMLRRSDTTTLRLLNIGGGTAIDSLNALILLRRQLPDAFDHRRVVIEVLDLDRDGPAFGARALAALRQDGGPLAGLDATLRHAEYDWSAPDRLACVTSQIDDPTALVACSSEGGLLEYASDDEVVANLSALRALAPPVRVLVASVIRDGEIGRAVQRAGGLRLRLRDADAAGTLLAAAGWSLCGTVDCGPVYQVLVAR